MNNIIGRRVLSTWEFGRKLVWVGWWVWEYLKWKIEKAVTFRVAWIWVNEMAHFVGRKFEEWSIDNEKILLYISNPDSPKCQSHIFLGYAAEIAAEIPN